MNNIPSPAAQAETFPPRLAFPQPIPAVIQALSAGDAIQAILHLFDAGAIAPAVAEDWLLSIETNTI